MCVKSLGYSVSVYSLMKVTVWSPKRLIFCQRLASVIK